MSVQLAEESKNMIQKQNGAKIHVPKECFDDFMNFFSRASVERNPENENFFRDDG